MIGLADTMGVTRLGGRGERARGAQTGWPAPARKAIGRFMSTMERLRERAESGAPVAELLEETLGETATSRRCEAERTIEAQGRIENLEELVRVAREYDARRAEEPALGEFLQQISLLSDADALRDDEGLVTLMTLHNAKGLEFPIVFIIGCEDGVFPHARALDEGDLEEERRLAYVGITRAMRDLYLTYARRRNVFGSTSFGMRSRFIDEIPRELTDQPAPGAAGRRSRPGAWRRGRARRPARRRPSAAAAAARSSASATTSSTRVRRGRGDRRSSRAGSSSCVSPATAPSAS